MREDREGGRKGSRGGGGRDREGISKGHAYTIQSPWDISTMYVAITMLANYTL